MKEYFEVKITVWKVVTILFILFSIYSFSTGWEYGFLGINPEGPDVWQGVARFVLIFILIIIIMALIVMFWGDGVTFNLKNPFYSQEDAEAWEEYQQWLKERENNKI